MIVVEATAVQATVVPTVSIEYSSLNNQSADNSTADIHSLVDSGPSSPDEYLAVLGASKTGMAQCDPAILFTITRRPST